VSIPFPELIFRDIRIEGSIIISKAMAEEMLQVVAEHNITVETNPMPGLKETPKLVELAHSGKMKGKGVIIMDQKQMDDEKNLLSKKV
jgi:propanol-preferring alcohol dehydrogenase